MFDQVADYIPEDSKRDTEKSRFIVRDGNKYNTYDMNLNDWQYLIKELNSDGPFSNYFNILGISSGLWSSVAQLNSLVTPQSVTMNLYYTSASQNSDVTADVIVSSNLGNKIISQISGKIGDTIKISVPYIYGYYSDRDYIYATINQDHTITTQDFVTYTKISSNNSNSNNNLKIILKDQLVATHPNLNNAPLYTLNGENFKISESRALAKDTDWFTDKYIDNNRKRYYRVATNEWVKSDDVYVYTDLNTVFKTDVQTNLITSRNTAVQNRGLDKSTSWKVDRIGYLGDPFNPTKAYRVATNEFVIID